MEIRDETQVTGKPRSAILRAAVAAIVLIGVAGACTAAATPSPAGPWPTATVSPADAVPTPSATLTPSAMPTPLGSLEPAASGTWTGLRWVVDPAAPFASPMDGGTDESYHLFGWSRGYLAFRGRYAVVDPEQPEQVVAVRVETSVDGLHWTAGQSLNVAGISGLVGVTKMVEGPGGLLAVGRHEGSACGLPQRVEGLWTSSDGISWTRVDVAKAFGDDFAFTVDAGGAGYVATGQSHNGVPQVWTSSDGKTWQSSPLPGALTGKVVIDGAAAFAGGFVIAGAVPDDAGCASGTLDPALWWSASGKTWARSALPGAVAAPDTSLWIRRINDSALVANASSYDEATNKTTESAWVSTDGKSWSPVATSPWGLGDLVGDGSRALVVPASPDEAGKVDIWAYEPDLSLVKLAQSGDLPIDLWTNGWQTALGPAGLVATDFVGTRFYLGIPR